MPAFIPYIEPFLEALPGLTIPLWQALMFVVVTSIAALYQRYRVILIFAYFFMVYWVFLENRELLALNLVWIVTGFIFLAFGLVAVVLTLYSMFTSAD